MALNLGDVNQGAVASDESFEDVYLEFLEADQAFVNLINAMEIAEKAQASGSMECMNFAEDLLGYSCEAVLKGDSGKMARNAAVALEGAKKSATLLLKQLDTIGDLEGIKKVVEVPGAVIAAADKSHGGSVIGLRDLSMLRFTGKTANKTIQAACEIVKTALKGVIATANQLSGTKGTAVIRYGFKKNYKYAGADSDLDLRFGYGKMREGMASVLAGARKTIKAIIAKKAQAGRTHAEVSL